MIDFNRMIDNYLKREHKPKGIGRYYPSEIGTCLRKIWYSYKYPMEVKPDLLKIFEVGNILHDFVVEVLKSEKNPEVELLKSEFSFQEEIEDFTVSGRVDNLILLKLSGKSVLVEVKSITDIKYVNEPNPHHIMQLQYYMHTTGVHNGILLYVDKKNLQSKVFSVEYNEKEAEDIINRFQKLHKHLTADIIPNPESREQPGRKLWMCRYCEYRERCYEATPKSGEWL